MGAVTRSRLATASTRGGPNVVLFPLNLSEGQVQVSNLSLVRYPGPRVWCGSFEVDSLYSCAVGGPMVEYVALASKCGKATVRKAYRDFLVSRHQGT